MKSHAYSYTYIISESKNIQNLVQLDQFGTFETFASANNTQFMLKFSVEVQNFCFEYHEMVFEFQITALFQQIN